MLEHKQKKILINLKNKKAFSIIEVLVSIAIFIMITSMGVGAYFTFYQNSFVRIEHSNVLNQLKTARFLALKNSDASNYGVYFDIVNNKVIMFKDTYVEGANSNNVLKLKHLTIEELNISPNPGVTSEILFERSTAKTNNMGSVLMKGNGEDFTFTVNSQGIIE